MRSTTAASLAREERSSRSHGVARLGPHRSPRGKGALDTDGTPVAESGLSVATLRRQPDHSWKTVLDNPFGARLMP